MTEQSEEYQWTLGQYRAEWHLQLKELNGTQRAWNRKENAKLDFMKILTIGLVKDTLTRMKDKSQTERKFFKLYIYIINNLYSKYIKGQGLKLESAGIEIIGSELGGCLTLHV